MAEVKNSVPESASFPHADKITVAVVTGQHPFDVPRFHNLFRRLPGVDAYPQDLDEFVNDWGNVRTRYDVVLFFNWHLETPPTNEHGWWQVGKMQVLEELGETEQGIVVLHMAVDAFPDWPFWSELVGIPHAQRGGFKLEDVGPTLSFGESIHVEIADPKHPITRDLKPWDFVGETWGAGAISPSPSCHVLMTTDHPKMHRKAMAWTHQFRKARVFYLQPGHDNVSWANPTFRTVLLRGIQWVARRL